jgi:2-polyprenyl-6-hydroxyphenyl methylase/3-demethylubiquinone-9 3-methyltransferase
MSTENMDALKAQPGTRARLTYRLRNANVYVSDGGFHFIDYLDPVEEIPPQIDASELTDEVAAYIETQLQANENKFHHQAGILAKYIPLPAARVLDVGCGGGLFLSLLKQRGAQVLGIELSDSRAQYAKRRHGLEIIKRPIESDFWQKGYVGCFDAVTLWDVIEHVNFPFQTIQSAANVLKAGGLLLIDTPCRDGFYHRFGAFTYRLTGGRFPTFLNAMYSSHRFGHKQIFSTGEMKQLIESAGLAVVELRKFHELSFPYEFYLKKLFRSQAVVNLLLPFVTLLFKVFKIQNKVLVIGRKST